MQVSVSRICVPFLLLLGFVFPIPNSFAQAVADATEQMQEQEEMTFRAPLETDGQLAWKFEEGQSFKVSMNQNTDIEMDLGGQAMGTTTTAVNELSLTIGSVDADGVASATNTIDRMVISTKTPMMSFEFDSNNEEDGEGPAASIAQAIRPMIGQPMTQKMKPNGEISDVQIPEEALEGIAGGNPQMAGMFSEKTLEDMATKSSLVFSEPVQEIGATWNVAETIDMGEIKVSTSTEYTYRGVADIEGKPMHVIEGDVTMDFPNGGTGGADVEITDQDSKITFYFDGVAGRMVKSELDQNVSMSITAAGQKIAQELKQTMTMTITPVE